LDAFGKDKKQIQDLKDHYQKGGLGDMVCKKYLIEVLEDFLNPIREKRKELEKDKKYVLDILLKGSEEAKKIASNTLKEVKEAMFLISV
jgi:tryptophanyl-tRNA synthetase